MCPDCGAPRMNHTLCLNCGKYKGKAVVDVHAALAKKEKKMKARNQAAGIQSDSKAEESKK